MWWGADGEFKRPANEPRQTVRQSGPLLLGSGLVGTDESI